MKHIFSILMALILSQNLLAGQVVESVVAVVNGSIITQQDMRRYREQLKAGTIVDDLFGSDPKALLKDDKALLNHLINERLVDEEVKRQGLTANVERVEQEINSIQARNRINREQLIEAIRREGTKFSDYQEFVKKRLERQSLIERAITSKIKISDEDVISLYESKNKNLTVNSFEFKLAHILFRAGKRSDEDQKARAELVLRKLKSGDSFEELASQYSEDPNYSEGGFLGTFRMGEFLKPLEDAIKTLGPGEVAGPIKTKLGYHIVKLLERHIVPDAKFEGQKEQLRGELYQKAFVKQFQFWLDQKRQEAFIRIN